jgi:hypothetical protein
VISVEEQLGRAEQFLAGLPGAAERAMARALNRAADNARGEAVHSITARYAASAGDVRGMISVSEAKPDALQVTIRARSKALSVGYFPHNPTEAKTGGPGRPALEAEIRRGGRRAIAGAFVAKLNSGLRIMRRTGKTTASGKAAIESVYTIPLAGMLGVPNVRVAVEQKALAQLDQQLDVELDRELAKGGPR